MPRESQESLSDKERNELLKILEEQGRTRWFERWKEHIAFPSNVDPLSSDEREREKVLRYLLLRVLINQQARFEKAREMSIKLSENFADLLLFRPFNISESELFKVFEEVAGRRGSFLYRVGALGGIKPISLFAYRFKAYEGFIRWLEESKKNFYELTRELQKPLALFEFLNTHPVLEAGWVGNDPKACRMLADWIVFLANEIWKLNISEMKETLMIVDGHVGKVFCRSGLLGKVLYEGDRPYIILASKIRPWIEEIILGSGRIPFYVDNGAFYLFEDGFCTDLNPDCESCPISKTCKKYTKWTAYQRLAP